MSPFEIYEYSTTQAVLLGYAESRREVNPNFSTRAWSKRLQLSTSGVLVNILKGRRKIPKKFAVRFGESMGLKGSEMEYFRALVMRDHAAGKDPLELVEIEASIEGIRHKSGSQTLNENESVEFARLLVVTVNELVSALGPATTMDALEQALRFPVPRSELESAVETLVRLKILNRDDSGKLSRPNVRGVETSDGVPSDIIRKFHRESLVQALQTLDGVPVDERYFSSYALPVEISKLPEARAALDMFLHDFVSRFIVPAGSGEAVYQMNLNFVPLSKVVSREL